MNICLFPARYQWDHNGDGLVTISDVWSSIKMILLIPGDYAIDLLGKPMFGGFFELNSQSCGGAVSAAISTGVWLMVIPLIVSKR